MNFLFAAPIASGTDFRVESKVFKGNDEQPDSTGVTIFQDDTIYDFANEKREITILAPKQERIILLDQTREQKTEISTKHVALFCEQMLKRRDSVTDAKLKFMLQPEFKVQPGNKAGELTFQSDYVTYQIEGFSPSDKSVAKQYREFSDLSAKINAIVNHGWPPFARMNVNQRLADDSLVPTKATLFIPAKPSGTAADSKATIKNVADRTSRTIHLRSQHQIQMDLTADDQNKVAKAKSLMQTLKPVSLTEYMKKPGN
jgi:hypothetical protein